MPEREKDAPTGLHVGIIMDGNGRWATERGKSRLAGHRAGVQVVRDIAEAAPNLGIGTLTLYAFSSDNWKRPPEEVLGLMRLFRSYLVSEASRCAENRIRLSVIGRRDRLSPSLARAIQAAERTTQDGGRLLMRIAIDYSARDSILSAAAAGNGLASRAEFGAAIARAIHSPVVPDVDLLIRTGREQRLSDFLLWECAYAELMFTEEKWPEFSPQSLQAALHDFRLRDRRFGGLVQVAS